ncbi:MAG: hypothetical protein JSR82_08220, partial [Verrucomicrobia bacterium]|nr:hypothetical protein [Verrucomicrobiota bacterium]
LLRSPAPRLLRSSAPPLPDSSAPPLLRSSAPRLLGSSAPLAGLWAGIYQVRTGLRNRQMTTIVLVLAGLLYVSALAVRLLD